MLHSIRLRRPTITQVVRYKLPRHRHDHIHLRMWTAPGNGHDSTGVGGCGNFTNFGTDVAGIVVGQVVLRLAELLMEGRGLQVVVVHGLAVGRQLVGEFGGGGAGTAAGDGVGRRVDVLPAGEELFLERGLRGDVVGMVVVGGGRDQVGVVAVEELGRVGGVVEGGGRLVVRVDAAVEVGGWVWGLGEDLVVVEV
uniref:(northern house mosquito) hypothetical protein n=1 Tax=Culex pipiens TaxID=7175 RepID=A0A8D8HSM1_CULPI